MIERFYLKDYLSFDKVELEFKPALVVFSGASGSGKSILMQSILSSVGLSSCEASVCESNVYWEIDEDKCGIENEDVNVFRHIKKDKVRYFINSQSVSKKTISNIASKHLRHLSLRDFSDFENENLLELLDNMADKKIKETKQRYVEVFLEFEKVKKELQNIEEEAQKVEELKEFAIFEIQKIENINPKTGEDEKLLKIKKDLSRKEKIAQSIQEASGVFEFEHRVSKALAELDIDSNFFDEAMNELHVVFDETQERFDELEEIDVEEVLNRIEVLSELKRRYGSIEDAIEYKKQKENELKRYENLSFEAKELEKRYDELNCEIKDLLDTMTAYREKALPRFNKKLNDYLKELYLQDAKITITQKEWDKTGKDKVNIELSQVSLQKISTGEFNRLRLAILAIKSEFMSKNGGVLMLDEIDANLSGEESMSVAKVLRKLSKHFQIFVISHQPQLTSMGEQHFLVYKDEDVSHVKELEFDERVDEIARIISGENISKEAKEFAKELLEGAK